MPAGPTVPQRCGDGSCATAPTAPMMASGAPDWSRVTSAAAPLIAAELGAGFVPVRKQGKLPGACVQATFEKEYGADVFEMQRDAIPAGANVLVVDDLIATGGSAAAAGSLVRQLQARVVEYVFVVSIPCLKGADKLDAPEYHLVEMD